MTVLERLLRGDEAKHGRDLILQVIETKRIDDEDHILVVDTRDITWFNKDEINEYRNIKFTDLGQPRTIENGLKEGDVLINPPSSTSHHIIGVTGNIVFSKTYIDGSVHTTELRTLIKNGWKLALPEITSEKVNMTVAEVEKLVGKAVNIVKE